MTDRIDDITAPSPADERAAFVKLIGYDRPETEGVAVDVWDSQRATWLEALDFARATSANDTGAAGAKAEAEIRKSMTSEQIQLERKLTCEAIDGAMAFGYQNTNPPPSADHWLASYWHVGRKQAELESRSPAMAEAVAIPVGYALVPIEPTEKMINEGSCAQSLPGPHYISESAATQCWRNMIAAAPQPAQAAALATRDAGMTDELVDTLKLAIGYIGSSIREDRHEHIARIHALLNGAKQ